MKRSVLRFAIFLLLTASNVALADGEFATFILENDAFTDNSDDGYTSGLGYAWGRVGFDEFGDSNTPGWIQWLSEDLYISTMPDKRRAITYQIFQSMTNPSDTDTSEPQPDDYPYAGTLTWKMASVARRIYDQMPEPKWVIAMGVCASSGGLYRNYSVVPGVDRILPVDVYTIGCPPRPDTLIRAVMELQKKIEEQGIDGRRPRQPIVVGE